MRVSERVEPAAFTEMDAIGGDCENLWIKLFESQLSQIFFVVGNWDLDDRLTRLGGMLAFHFLLARKRNASIPSRER